MGFEVEDDPDRVGFSKLFLDKDQVRKGQTLAIFTKLASEYDDNDLMEGITKYLAALRKRALEHMEQTWDAGVSLRFTLYPRAKFGPIEFVRGHVMDFTLSVPAIWSENAKQKTMECALRAKLGSPDRPGSIRPVSEPEAAAAYAITTVR